ncbi:MAG TPA: lytic murein transglycosylase [Solirubrobacterales bacterium]
MSPAGRPSFPALLLAAPAAALLAIVGGAVCIAVAFGGGGGACTSAAAAAPPGGGASVHGVPSKLIPIYQQAAATYHLGPKGPAMLASINFNETSFGTNMNNTTGSGAEGWMMFMPETWASYGVDANHDGKRDPFNPWDAIFAAARYLRANGAPANWPEAIFAYNHAGWYVQRVLGDAERFAAIASVEVAAEGEACGAQLGPIAEPVKRMLAAAYREAAKQLPYIWGGFDPNAGFDCSGGVSWVLNIGGFFTGRTDTTGLTAWGQPGPGKWITVYVKTSGDAEEEHTAIEIAGVLFESGGGGENENPNGGWGKVDPHQRSTFLAQFDTKRHPARF